MIVATLVVAALATGPACDGGGSGSDGERLSLADYATEIKSLNDRAESQFDDLALDLDSGGTLDARKAGLIEFWEAARGVFEAFVDDLDDVGPPTEAQEIHTDTIQAGEDVVTALDGLIDDIEGFDSMDDLANIDSPDVAAAGAGFTKACADLQRLVDENGIDVMLGCGDTGG